MPTETVKSHFLPLVTHKSYKVGIAHPTYCDKTQIEVLVPTNGDDPSA